MGFFSFFRRRRKAVVARKTKGRAPRVSEMVHSMQTEIDRLHGRLGTIDIAIKKHHDQLAEHDARLQEHGEKLLTLEQKVTVPAMQPMTPRQLTLQPAENSAHVSVRMAQPSPAQQFDIEQFTEQQKRVLAVFFQNKGMRMSYVDVARVLNKSAYTVKNQMNQIRQKADLFEQSIGRQSRNLFKLKDDLRIEKYLKVGQPVERPVSVAERDESEVESDGKEAEPIPEYVQERSEPKDES